MFALFLAIDPGQSRKVLRTESIRHFVDHLISGEPLRRTHAFNTTMVIQAIMESAKRREPFEVQY